MKFTMAKFLMGCAFCMTATLRRVLIRLICFWGLVERIAKIWDVRSAGKTTARRGKIIFHSTAIGKPDGYH
jgi:hypothetical protein